MNLITQVFNELKNNYLKVSIFALLCALTMYLLSFVPVIASYFLGAAYLKFAFIYTQTIHRGQKINLMVYKKVVVGIAIGGLFLIPSVFLIGAAMSSMSTLKNSLSVFSFSIFLFLIGIYFLICAQAAVEKTFSSAVNFLKALDEAFKDSAKNMSKYFWTCLILAISCAIISYIHLAGFVLMFPVLFSVGNFLPASPHPVKT